MEFFSRLGLADPLAAALGSFGFAAPTPVQADAIPIILSRRDAIIESETGTGKTFAYLAPAFQLVSVLERKGLGEPGVIVAAPTQELAVQIGRESERLAKAAGLGPKTVVLLGGTPLEKQAAKLKSKPEIIVGTLGRLADLVALGKLRTAGLKLLVLDEADRLFANETEELARALLKSAPASCTRVLVSATIPERVRREARPLLRDAVEICPVGETVLSGSIEHWCFYCDGRKRLDFTRRFEAAVRPERCLVFLTMATRVEKAALALAALGLPVGAIHSGMDKETRRVALERFARGELRYLLTSDLGARGLDIQGITHVLSLDLPEEATVYTHRAGRTGRAGATGVSVVLADGVELARASKVATKGGFVFRCKVLEEGKILEPTSEEFFARAGAAEEQRMAAKASHILDDERRGPAPKRYDTQSPPAGHQKRDTQSLPLGPQRRDTKSAPQGSQGRHTKSPPTGPQRRDTKSAPQESRRYTKSSPTGFQRRDTKSSPTGFQRRDTKSSPTGFQRRDTKSSPTGPQRRDTKSAPQESRRYTKSAPQGSQGRHTKVPEGEASRTARKPRSTPWRAGPGKPSPGPHPAPRQRSDRPHMDRPIGSPAKTRRPPRP